MRETGYDDDAARWEGPQVNLVGSRACPDRARSQLSHPKHGTAQPHVRQQNGASNQQQGHLTLCFSLMLHA